jgi:hypothetical protein
MKTSNDRMKKKLSLLREPLPTLNKILVTLKKLSIEKVNKSLLVTLKKLSIEKVNKSLLVTVFV